MPGYKIEVGEVGHFLVFRLGGEFDLLAAGEFRRLAEIALTEGRHRNLCVNLSEVSFIDSSGLGAILGRYKRISQIEGRMTLVGASEGVRNILELSGVLKIIPLYGSEHQAVGA